MKASRCRTVLVTPSYLPDLERCTRLVESSARYCSGFEEHVVIVPQKDMSAFKSLEGFGIRLLAAEELLPNHIVQTWVSRFWWDRTSLRMRRGWLVQQLIKLAATQKLDADACVFADSDACFIRPFDAKSLWYSDKIRLYRSERAPLFYTNRRYLNWYGAAAGLVGRPQDSLDYAYISQLTSMRKDNVLRMIERIQQWLGLKDWQRALLDVGDISEFILYGCFCEQQPYSNGHWFSSEQLCHSSWFYSIESVEDIESYLEQLSVKHVAVHIQSNLNQPVEAYWHHVKALQQ